MNISYKLTNEISAVLFDIDGTITYRSRPSAVAGAKAREMSFWTAGTSMFSDVPVTIKALYAAGFPLYTATTNASFVALEKLALCGLASGAGSPYFKGVLGGNELSPKGKTSPQFFRDLLSYYKLDPARVLHVGDDPVLDVLCPMEAGISQAVLIDRDQDEPVRELNSGGIAINRLDLLLVLLGIKESAGNLAV